MSEQSLSQTVSAQAIRLAISRYWQQVKADRWRVAIGLLLPGIGNILILYAPTLVIAQLLNHFKDGGQLHSRELIPYVLVFGGLWLSGELCWRIGNYLMIHHEARSIGNLYNNAMQQLLRRDIAFFHDNFAGSLTKKAVGYGKNYELFMDTMMFSVVAQILPMLFVIGILAHYSWWLVLVLFGMLGITIAVIYPLILKRQKLVEARETASNVVAGHFSDVISNMDVVQAFAHEQQEAETHRQHVRSYMTKACRSWAYQNTYVEMTTMPLYVLTNVLGLCVALALSKHGILNFGVIFVSFNYFASTTRIVWEFNRIYRNLEASITEAAQFTSLMIDEPKVLDHPRAAAFQPTHGRIEFHNVTFRYAEDSHEALFEHLTLTIKSGEKVALVGHSGGGKTTITKLLLRFMDIEAGEIVIDGQNIAESRQADVRSAIAYVPQEPLMFHRSLLDNIRYGQIDANDKAVIAAARLANASEFIDTLPGGYDTLVGERGVKLSGGQRQRIAVARAILKNAPILVLDEATSALDSESEALIQDALWRLMEHRTALVIAHRLSTIQRMDRIIVLDQGNIVEEGSHKELISKKGVYASLWARQSGGFMEE